MKATLVILPGDGIGPEVTAEAVRVLERVATHGGHGFTMGEAAIGGAALAATGTPLPPETLDACAAADAVFLGAVGDPRWNGQPPAARPEAGLLALRAALGVFANLRPVLPHPRLAAASPLRPEVLRNVDVLFVRELTGGIYFGPKRREAEKAVDECVYHVAEVERIARFACRVAMQRDRRLTSVDKANVLETSRLWREVVERIVADEFPTITLEHQLVDAMAMHILRRPSDFDVVLTSNMFGDILSDEASMLAGALGLLPSASLDAEARGLYEPVHGSAPDIAGKGIANPYGAILSAAMLLRHSLDLASDAAAVERAVDDCLARGVWTADLAGFAQADAVGTREAGDAVLDALDRQYASPTPSAPISARR